jgi:hypothetical protein
MSSESRAEADGSFVLAGLQPGAYRLTASAPGYAEGRRQAATGSDNVEIVLEPAGVIAGSVVDETGRPVETFTVVAQDSRPEGGGMISGAQLRETLTPTDGRFQLDGAAAGTWVVTVEAPDLAPVTVSDVKVSARATTDIGQVRLTRGGTLRGSVVDPDGRPVPAAQVTARGGGSEFVSYGDRLVASTDIDGAFEIKGIPTGTVKAMASHPNYAKAQVSGIEVDPAKGPAQTRMVMTQGGRIEGWARQRDGSPMLGVQVRLWPAESGALMGPPELVPIQADGSFLIEHVAPGRHRATLMAGSAGRLHSTQTREVNVHEGETVTVDFSSLEILVSGRVTRGGTPMPNVKLDLSGGTFTAVMRFVGAAPSVPARAAGPQRMTAVTREDGAYDMIAEEPGSLRLSVESLDGKTRYLGRSIELPDVATYVLDLDLPSQQIAGVVLDEDTGQPLADASVVAVPLAGAGGVSTTTGPDGRFTLDVEAGDYRVTAEAEGYASEDVDTTAGSSGGGELRIELARGLQLKGKVIDAQGRATEGVGVAAASAAASGSDRHTDFTVTLADGSFRLTALKKLPYNLLSGSRTLGWGLLGGVEPGSKEVVLRLAPGGLVRLAVRGPEGAPVFGATCGIASVGGLPVSNPGSAGRSDASGLLEVGVPAGSVELRVGKVGLEGRVTVTVPAGGAVAAEATLSEAKPKAR